MAFAHGKNTTVYIGATDQSCYLNSTEVSADGDVAETTTYCAPADAMTFIRGHNGATVSFGGFYDPADGASDGQFSGDRTDETSTPTTFAPRGAAFGAETYTWDALETNYNISSSIGDAVAVAVEQQVTGPFDRGVSLHDLTAATADTNFTSVDNAASSANGGVGALHVTALTGFSTATVRVQHSTNDSVWVDLITFTAFTAATAERIAVSGTVNRYVRATVDVTGSGSTTFQASFARR